MRGTRILVTGPTGQVAKPLAISLAKDNDVIGVARFRDQAARAQLENAGVECVSADFTGGDLSAVPDDVDYVLNFAVSRTSDFDHDLTANAEAAGALMSHCRSATAFFHCSSTAVYQPNGHQPLAETDALGDNHRVPAMSFMPTYSISKIAAEAVVRFAAREFQLPTVIARLNVPYGDAGGWPAYHFAEVLAGRPVAVHSKSPSIFNPIHEDDIIATVPKLLEHASVPATIVNWGGSEAVSIEEWTQWFGDLVGKPVDFQPSDAVLETVTIDTAKQHALIGRTSVSWQAGMRRMVEQLFPDVVLSDVGGS